MALGRRGRCWAALSLAACEVAAPSDDIPPPDLVGLDLTPCAPAELASFRATLEPPPEEERIALSCAVSDARGEPGSRVLELACGERAMRLYLEVEPAPAGDGFAAGQALKLTAIRAPREGGLVGEVDTWLRVETTAGALLVAAAAGSRLEPPDGTSWSAPFSWREAPSGCMTEETACGESGRGALDLQLSGGAPRRLYDGTSARVGDEGAFSAVVEAARTIPPGSGCPREFVLGLVAVR